ncbi:MAG: hypothetical protein ACI87E_004691, partial [Mariniblastus sp.]
RFDVERKRHGDNAIIVWLQDIKIVNYYVPETGPLPS